MSHDRGCFKCFRDRGDYASCELRDCPKKESPTMSLTIQLPPPPSVNRTRKLDKRGLGAIARWRDACNKQLMRQRVIPGRHGIKGPYEIYITLAKHLRTDPDNILKSTIDYLRHIEITEDDSPKYVRKIVVEWGPAPEGMVVTMRPAR